MVVLCIFLSAMVDSLIHHTCSFLRLGAAGLYCVTKGINPDAQCKNCKMRLTSLHDSYVFFFVGSLNLFVASLVFIKGTSRCVIKTNF